MPDRSQAPGRERLTARGRSKRLQLGPGAAAARRPGGPGGPLTIVSGPGPGQTRFWPAPEHGRRLEVLRGLQQRRGRPGQRVGRLGSAGLDVVGPGHPAGDDHPAEGAGPLQGHRQVAGEDAVQHGVQQRAQRLGGRRLGDPGDRRAGPGRRPGRWRSRGQPRRRPAGPTRAGRRAARARRAATGAAAGPTGRRWCPGRPRRPARPAGPGPPRRRWPGPTPPAGWPWRARPRPAPPGPVRRRTSRGPPSPAGPGVGVVARPPADPPPDPPAVHLGLSRDTARLRWSPVPSRPLLAVVAAALGLAVLAAAPGPGVRLVDVVTVRPDATSTAAEAPAADHHQVRRCRPRHLDDPPAGRPAGVLLRRPRRPGRRAPAGGGGHRRHHAARLAPAAAPAGPAGRGAPVGPHRSAAVRGQRRGGRHGAAAPRRHLPAAVGARRWVAGGRPGSGVRPTTTHCGCVDSASGWTSRRSPTWPCPARYIDSLGRAFSGDPRRRDGPGARLAARHARRRRRDRAQALAGARLGEQLAHRAGPGGPAGRAGAAGPAALRPRAGRRRAGGDGGAPAVARPDAPTACPPACRGGRCTTCAARPGRTPCC